MTIVQTLPSEIQSKLYLELVSDVNSLNKNKYTSSEPKFKDFTFTDLPDDIIEVCKTTIIDDVKHFQKIRVTYEFIIDFDSCIDFICSAVEH